MSKCATIGTVQESFKRPTERFVHGPKSVNVRARLAAKGTGKFFLVAENSPLRQGEPFSSTPHNELLTSA